MAECFYCGAEAKLTRAHLFQQGFRGAIKVDSDQVTLAATSVKELGVYHDVVYTGNPRQFKVTSLCVDCNAGWMNDIERAAAPVFQRIMKGGGFPPPADLFKLAHWSVVVGVLASEMVRHLEIPVAHRRAIRFTRTGQPADYATHFIWTLDYLPSVVIDVFRCVFAGAPFGEDTGWCTVIHVGPLVIVSTSPALGPRVSRVLQELEIESVLAAISSNIVYFPARATRPAYPQQDAGLMAPSHAKLRELPVLLFNADESYLTSRGGSRLFDLNAGLTMRQQDLGFDYGNTLTDARDELDLSYLDGSFR